MLQAPALPARLVKPETWALPTPFSPHTLTGCVLLRVEGSPPSWLPGTCFSVRKAVPVLLSPSLNNSLHSSRLTIVPGFQNADLGDGVAGPVRMLPNWKMQFARLSLLLLSASPCGRLRLWSV